MDPHRRTRRFKVGLLVLGTSGLFFGLLLFILGSSLGSRLESYELMFAENVKGMVVGSRVNFQGVPVGAVRDIRFEDGLTLVEIAVDPAKAILQTVTRGRIDRLLVTGQVTIELEGYQRDAAILSPGSRIMVKPSPMNQLTVTLPDTLERADRLIERTTAVMAGLEDMLGPANRRTVASILGQLDAALAALTPRLLRTGELAESALAEFGPLLAQARTMLGSEDARALAVTACSALQRFEALAGRLDALALEASGVLGGARRPLLETLVGARDALAEIDRLARSLRLAPPSLLHGRDVKELVPAAAPGDKR